MASFEHNKSILPPLLFIITVLLIVSLFLSLSSTAAAATRDTITPTQPLADNETLVSAPLGTFALGFFTPNNSDRRYIGIWYYNTTYNPKTIVWVANRDSPVTRSTGQLSVTANGTITITNRETSTAVWSSVATNSRLTNPVLQLLDTGNFVVKEEEGTDDSQKYAWQSFDYPTDTLLPGMKLGVDRIAGGLSSRNLTAWKSDQDDPSPGEYCAAMGTVNSPEMYLFDRSTTTKIWRSGPWDGIQLGGIPNLNGGVTYSLVNNNEELSYSFQVSDQTITPLILKVSQSGILQLLIWLPASAEWFMFWSSPANRCDKIGWCGSYAICDYSTDSSAICRCLQGFTPKNQANWESSMITKGDRYRYRYGSVC